MRRNGCLTQEIRKNTSPGDRLYVDATSGWIARLSIERTQNLEAPLGSVDLVHDAAMCNAVEEIRARYKALYEEPDQLLFRLGS